MPRSPSPARERERKRERSRSRERDHKRRKEDYDHRRRDDYDRKERGREDRYREGHRDDRRRDIRDERRDSDRHERDGRRRDDRGRDHERDERRASRHADDADGADGRRRETRDSERGGRGEDGPLTRAHSPNRSRSRSHSRGRDAAVGSRALADSTGAPTGSNAAPETSPSLASQKANGASGAAGAAAAAKAEPLSLEEILLKRKQQQEAEAKPKFLTKAERQALALARRQEEVAAQRAHVDEMRRLHSGPSALSTATPAPSDARRPEPLIYRSDRDRDREHGRGRDRERDRDRDRDKGHDREWGRKDGNAAGKDSSGGAGDGEDGKSLEERERERELELIRQQYLGGGRTHEPRKITKASDKFRFQFEWDAKEDTSKDLNPLYNNTHEAALMFGRGMRAGIDRREQKKAAAAVEAASLRKLREAAGITETHDMRELARAREAEADRYDGFDMKVDKHWTEKALEDMTERDWRIFREDFNIAYRGHNPTTPLRAWKEADLPRDVMKGIERVGYAKPSPIQMAAIPLGLKQLDVIGIAETGSGKTAAFVIPMLVYISRQPPMTEANEADGPYAVVLAPTRELAQQIEEETLKLAHYTPYRVMSIVGGQSIEEQGSKLRKGCEVVIATPGRLIDCLERHYAVLNQCNYVVLDEADRMIDLGFDTQVQGVLDAMPSATLKPEDEGAALEEGRVYRTTYMFSATMPPAVERLARKYLRRPVVVTIGSAGRATDNVTQRVIMVKENEKAARLESELALVDEKRAIVFVNTKRQCDNVYGQLESLGYRCTVLHGGRSQEQREVSIKGFREDVYNVLIATDVAGRGIDVPDVALVVNYDMPGAIEPYTHRIGRTGRAGKKGTAITFLTGGDTEVYYDLKKLLEDSKAPVPPELARHEAAKNKPGTVTGKRDAVVYAKK